MKPKLALVLLALSALVACGGPATTPVANAPTAAPTAATAEAPVATAEQAAATQAPAATEAAAVTEAPMMAATDAATAATSAPTIAAAVTDATATAEVSVTTEAPAISETSSQIIIMQVQVPTTADKPPTLNDNQGEKYFSIQMSTGETIILVPSQGFRWLKIEPRDDSATPGVINYWLYGAAIGGPIIVQAQVPTTADKPPKLNDFQGEKNFNIETTKGGAVQVLSPQGFTWNRSELNPDSVTPGIINYWLYAEPVAVAAPAAATEVAAATAAPAATAEVAAATAAPEVTVAPAATAAPAGAAQSTVTCDAQYAAEIPKFKDAAMAEIETERAEATSKDGIARPALLWNDQLACQAQEWAQAIATDTYRQNPHCCYAPIPIHSDYRTWKLGAPEGISAGKTIVEGIQLWRTLEMPNFNFAASEAAKRHDHTCLPTGICGHYGAVIGLFTTEVGCGFYPLQTGKERNYNVVCQYVFKQTP